MLRPYIRFGVYPRHRELTLRCPTPAPRAPPAAPLPGCGAGRRNGCPRARGCDRRARHPGARAPGRGAGVGRGGGRGRAWNGRRRGLHSSRRAADGDSSAAGAGARLSGRPYPAGVVLGGGRRTRHSRGSGPPDRRRGVQPGVPTTHDGVPVLPGAHAERTDPGGRRHRPPAHRQLTRPAPWAGSKESQLTMLIALVLGLSVLALVVAWGLRGYVLRQDTGTPEMRKISDAIQEGAEAFLRRQYRTIGLMSIALGLLIYVLYAFLRKPHADEPTVRRRVWGAGGSGPRSAAMSARWGGASTTRPAAVGPNLAGNDGAGIRKAAPRTPAVIADLVGDNAGDCAGRGADLFESTAA